MMGSSKPACPPPAYLCLPNLGANPIHARAKQERCIQSAIPLFCHVTKRENKHQASSLGFSSIASRPKTINVGKLGRRPRVSFQ